MRSRRTRNETEVPAFAGVARHTGEAIRREKQLKKWRRAWKIELIERANPDWRDLFDEIAS